MTLFHVCFSLRDNYYTRALLRTYLTYSILGYLLLKCHFEIVAYCVLALITASKLGEIYCIGWSVLI